MTLHTLADALLADPALAAVPLARELVPVLVSRAGTSSAGYPYLSEQAYTQFRDHVPHVLGMGPVVSNALDQLVPAARALADEDDLVHLGHTERVIRTMLNTATITAPCDLWLLRHVLGAFAALGLTERLLAGEQIDPATCRVRSRPGEELVAASARELAADLRFLETRGYVVRNDDVYTLAPGPVARDTLTRVRPVPQEVPSGVAHLWLQLFQGTPIDTHEATILARLGAVPTLRTDLSQDGWAATLDEITLGYRLLPIVLGLRHAERIELLTSGKQVAPQDLSAAHPELVAGALDILAAAGALERDDTGTFAATPLGVRLLQRGPGPFGIIEAYHPYMAKLGSILLDGHEAVWVNRTTNVAASQDANRRTFAQCNDSLDAFCKRTGFSYRVFIEHALGRGEATRQRWNRSKDAGIRYFGADLEHAAIEAAVAERDAGHLPPGMLFVRGADIGEPSSLLAQIRAAGATTRDAVMLVGNGFHEVRNQTRAKMVRVFREYCEAGIVLLFTEANALTASDLLATAWNTYHAGFMYVHEKSGQGLRPAERTHAYDGSRLPASWTDCATAAGYVRLDEYSSRSRTAFPTMPRGAQNPSISVNHFYVPAELAERLALREAQ